MKFLALATLLMSSMVFASSQIDDTNAAVTASLEEFKASQPQEVVDSFTGIKAWPVSGGVKSKIYLKNNLSIDYSCHKHTANDPFECHEL